jgi:hypothetical protein
MSSDPGPFCGLLKTHPMREEKAHRILTDKEEKKMTEKQRNLYDTRTHEMQDIAAKIEALPIGDEWVTRFTNMAYYRGWRRLDTTKQQRLINIANTESPSMATIIEQRHTKLSLERLEQIAITVTDEKARKKIKDILITKSWRKAKKEILLIIASYETKPE